MKEVKIQCECGQRYKFEVEPVNGQMPYAITCPVCGFDGTKKANEILQQMASAPPASASPAIHAAAPAARVHIPAGAEQLPVAALASAAAAPAPVATAPAPVAAASAPPPPTALGAQLVTPPSAGEKPRLRINKAAHEEPAAAPAEAAAGEHTAPPPPRPRPVPGMVRPAAQETSGRKPSFALGLLGGFAGALLGGLLYYLIFKMTESQIGLVGIAGGFLAGLGAKVLGKEGSNELGVITATLSLLGILGAQYLVARTWWFDWMDEEEGSWYEESVEEAKKAVAMIPNGSDEEIRVYLALDMAFNEGERVDPKAIPAEDVKDFRENALPEYRDLASGKMTKEQFAQKHDIQERTKEEKAKDAEEEEKTFKWFFLLVLLNKVNLFSMAAAAALAYKMSS